MYETNRLHSAEACSTAQKRKINSNQSNNLHSSANRVQWSQSHKEGPNAQKQSLDDIVGIRKGFIYT